MFHNRGTSCLTILSSNMVPVIRQLEYLNIFEPIARMGGSLTLQNVTTWRTSLQNQNREVDIDNDDSTITLASSSRSGLNNVRYLPAGFSSDSNQSSISYDFGSVTENTISDCTDSLDQYYATHRYDDDNAIASPLYESPSSPVGNSSMQVQITINMSNSDSEDWGN